MIEEKFLNVYRNFGAARDPIICQVSSLEKLLQTLFAKNLHSTKVLFMPWANCAPYSRPATFDDGSVFHILQDKFERYAEHYNHANKSSADNLVECIYENYEDEIDTIQAAAIVEFPEFGLDVEEYIFLSDFSWVSSEVSFFNEIIKIESAPSIKDIQFIELLETVLENKIFAVTLPDLVLYCYRS